jgi:hypothetical protein
MLIKMLSWCLLYPIKFLTVKVLVLLGSSTSERLEPLATLVLSSANAALSYKRCSVCLLTGFLSVLTSGAIAVPITYWRCLGKCNNLSYKISQEVNLSLAHCIRRICLASVRKLICPAQKCIWKNGHTYLHTDTHTHTHTSVRCCYITPPKTANMITFSQVGSRYWSRNAPPLM